MFFMSDSLTVQLWNNLTERKWKPKSLYSHRLFIGVTMRGTLEQWYRGTLIASHHRKKKVSLHPTTDKLSNVRNRMCENQKLPILVYYFLSVRIFFFVLFFSFFFFSFLFHIDHHHQSLCHHHHYSVIHISQIRLI